MKLRRMLGAGFVAAAALVSGCELDDSAGPSREENTRDTAWAINYLTGYLLRGYVANRQAGSHNITISCSRGGTINISGRTDYDTGTSSLSLDLTYEFNEARASVVATNLAVSFHPLAGTIRQTGTIRVGAGKYYEDSDAVSGGLAYFDTIRRAGIGVDTFAERGFYRIATRTSTDRSGAVFLNIRGVLDGHPFSWTYGVSGSSGGTNNNPDVVVIL